MSEYYAHNMEVVGYHDLDRKPGFKMGMQIVDSRWYLYIAHLWEPGWSILDVTDPGRPEKVGWIQGPENTWTIQVQVADGKMITGLEKISRGWGGDPDRPFEAGIYIWDVSDPVKALRLGGWRTNTSGTHRNHYDGGRYVHLAAAVPGFQGRIYVILDIDNPANPREVGRWFLPEQYEAGGGKPARPRAFLHGPAYAEGNRAYLSYGQGGMIILDISDLHLPRLVSQLDFGPAMGSSLGMHTVMPLPRRKLAVVNTEAIEENSDEPFNYAGLVDISDEASPRLISLFPVPEPPPGAPYANFQKRGGRCGPHNLHHYQHQECLLNRDDLVYLTYFNAGLRVYDIRDPYLPREVAYFVPPDPTERLGSRPKTLVAQTEDVLVDARGNAYITDKNLGLYVVRCTV